MLYLVYTISWMLSVCTENVVVFVLYEAPIALKSHGIFNGKKITSHPSVDKQLKEAGKCD